MELLAAPGRGRLSEGRGTWEPVQHVKQGVIEVFRRLADTFREPPLLTAPGVELLLDPALTLFPGDLAVVGARSHSQAEQVLLRIASEIALAVKPARDVLIVAEDVERAMTLMLAREARVSVRVAADPDAATRQDRVNLTYAAAMLNKAPIHFEAASVASTWKFLVEWLAQHPRGIAFLSAAWPVADRSYEQAARFVRDAKAIARDTEATIVLPWRLQSDARSPLVTDLLGCGAVEDDADLILLVQGVDSRVTNVSLAKNRHGPLEGVLHPAPAADPTTARRARRTAERDRAEQATLPAAAHTDESSPTEDTNPAEPDASSAGSDPNRESEDALLPAVLALLADGPLKAKQLVRRLADRGHTSVTKKALNRLLYRSIGTIAGLSVTDGVWRVDRA